MYSDHDKTKVSAGIYSARLGWAREYFETWNLIFRELFITIVTPELLWVFRDLQGNRPRNPVAAWCQLEIELMEEATIAAFLSNKCALFNFVNFLPKFVSGREETGCPTLALRLPVAYFSHATVMNYALQHYSLTWQNSSLMDQNNIELKRLGVTAFPRKHTVGSEEVNQLPVCRCFLKELR